MNAEKLSITLPVDMAQMIRRHVETGAYASNSEVIRDALRVWKERLQERESRLAAVRAKIEAAAKNPVRIADDEAARHFDELEARAISKASGEA
jgi:antitoxin ParD1/3/4